MSDYEIGYGKPPKASQFKPGVSGNRKGRPKRTPSDLATEILDVLESPIRHREGAQEKMSPAWELNLRALMQRALRGDPDAAMAVLRHWTRAERSKTGKQRVIVEDWLPDYPGQTAEDKTRAFARNRNAPPTEWWSKPAGSQKM
jgi:hypothetical protein